MWINFTNVISILIILLSSISCDAPKNNPLDPDNPDNELSSIEGYVKTVKVPQNPIISTHVYWKNDDILTSTNEKGYFHIVNINRVDGWVVFEKENYSTDSIYISFNNRKSISADIFLNATPQITDLKFFSVTTNKFPASQRYNLGVTTNIIDEENDIDSVFISNSELQFRKELFYNATTKLYENSIFLEDLRITSIDIVIGKNFEIQVVDSDGKKFDIGKSNIKRIIKEEIETTSPSGRDTVKTANPLLQWRRFIPGFSFKYLLEIYTDEVPAILIWQEEINSNLIEFQAEASLVKGDYFWVIWAIDEFDNRTRSKPASFIVN